MLGSKAHRYFYIIFLAGIGFSLPCSVFLTSAFTIALSVNWLFQTDTYINIRKTIPKYALVFLLIFFLYIIFIVNTENLEAGLKAVRLKLPLLAIPLVVASSKSLSSTEKQIILSSFIIGVLFASVSGSVYYYFIADDMTDRREIALFISHIRLSLMLCLSFFICAYYSIIAGETGLKMKYFYIISGIWFAAFLMILLSLTGIIIFLVVLFLTVGRLFLVSGTGVPGKILFVFAPILMLGILGYLVWQVKSYYIIKDDIEIDYSILSPGNRVYQHFPDRKHLENGHFVWRYICEPELRKEWNRISPLDYDGADNKGQFLKYTIIRYMSSLGLSKDSAGISLLEAGDIELIEAGYANCIYKDGTGLDDRVYELIWQIDSYIKGGNPQGHSVTQRVEFLRTGLHIFVRYPLFGTGTGDMNDEFREQYRIDNTMLEMSYRFISHNQFLTVLISFGVFGFSVFLFALFYPFIKLKGWNNYLFTVFFIIAILSMLNEDTLETNTGVTFFSFFYSVLLFAAGKNKINEQKDM